MSHEIKITIAQAKELLSKLLPENNMKIVFNIPGGSDSPDKLADKIKVELTTSV